jgi:hypothetical protein
MLLILLAEDRGVALNQLEHRAIRDEHRYHGFWQSVE